MKQETADLLLKKIVECVTIFKNDPATPGKMADLYQELSRAGYKCGPADGVITKKHIDETGFLLLSVITYLACLPEEDGRQLMGFSYNPGPIDVGLEPKTGKLTIDLRGADTAGLAHVLLLLMEIANTPRVGRCGFCHKFFFGKRSNKSYCSSKCRNDARNRKEKAKNEDR